MVRSNLVEKKLNASVAWVTEFSTIDYSLALHKNLFIRHYLSAFWSRLLILFSKTTPIDYRRRFKFRRKKLDNYSYLYDLAGVLALNTIFIKENFRGFLVFLQCSSFNKFLRFSLKSSQRKKYPKRFKTFTRSLALGKLPYQDNYDYLRNSSLNSPYVIYLGSPTFYLRLQKLASNSKILFNWEVFYTFKKDFSEDSIKVSFLIKQFGVFNTTPKYSYWFTSKVIRTPTFIRGHTLRYMFYNQREVFRSKKKELSVKLNLKHRVQKNETYLSSILQKNVHIYLRLSKITLRSSPSATFETSSVPTYPDYWFRKFKIFGKLTSVIGSTIAAVRWKDPNTLLSLVKYLIPKFKNQYKLVTFLSNLLPYSVRYSLNIKAIKIQLSGTFYKSRRTSQVTAVTSNRSFCEAYVANRCLYTKGYAIAKRGVFGIKVWIT